MVLNLDVLYFSILPGRDSKNFEIHCHGCSVHIYEKIRSAIKGETGIEGESRITRIARNLSGDVLVFSVFDDDYYTLLLYRDGKKPPASAAAAVQSSLCWPGSFRRIRMP